MTNLKIEHLTKTQLEAGLDTIFQSPKNNGLLAMIVRRPVTEQREVLETAELDVVEGLVGVPTMGRACTSNSNKFGRTR